jgi:hypothetical protein
MHNSHFTIHHQHGLAAVLCAVALILAWPAAAHHGDADRYNPEVVTVTGTVTDVQMVSPARPHHHGSGGKREGGGLAG